MQKFKAIIFDLDGTLLNTLDDLADSVNAALSKFGHPVRTVDEIRSFVGNGVELLIRRALAPVDEPDEIEQVYKAFSAIYSANMKNKTAPYPGINEVLSALKQKDVKMAVVSNKFHKAVVPLIKDYFGEYIPLAIGADENTPKKPDPTGTLKAVELMGVDKETTVYIGDSDVDIITAKNANLFALGCTWGFRDRELLQQSGADMIIDSPEEMLKLF